MDLIQKTLRERSILLVENKHAMRLRIILITYVAVDALQEVRKVLSQDRNIPLLRGVPGDN